jgi:tetratricopeptide (TPR) repeat protein
VKPLTIINRLGGIIGLGVMICSCTLSMPPRTTAIREVLFQQHRQQAVQLMQQDKLAEALTQWEILHAIMPEDDEIASQITEVQKSIQQRVKIYLQDGQKNMKRRQYQQAQRAFLAALALDPSQKIAHRYLQQMERARMKQALQHKLAQWH